MEYFPNPVSELVIDVTCHQLLLISFVKGEGMKHGGNFLREPWGRSCFAVTWASLLNAVTIGKGALRLLPFLSPEMP